jgi:hypothetical protein
VEAGERCVKRVNSATAGDTGGGVGVGFAAGASEAAAEAGLLAAGFIVIAAGFGEAEAGDAVGSGAGDDGTDVAVGEAGVFPMFIQRGRLIIPGGRSWSS